MCLLALTWLKLRLLWWWLQYKVFIFLCYAIDARLTWLKSQQHIPSNKWLREGRLKGNELGRGERGGGGGARGMEGKAQRDTNNSFFLLPLSFIFTIIIDVLLRFHLLVSADHCSEVFSSWFDSVAWEFTWHLLYQVWAFLARNKQDLRALKYT